MSRRRRKLIGWFIGGAAAVLAALWIAMVELSRAPILRQSLVQVLSDRLDADVDLGALEVTTFPLVRIHGDRLTVRLKGQTNPLPLIEVRHFEVTGGLLGLLHRPRRFRSVHLEGLRITIPPRTARDEHGGGKALTGMGGPPIIDHLESKDAQLIIVPKDPRKQPKVFAIHNLAIEHAGFDRSMPFTATLTNAVPAGEIASVGAFGPWVKDDPGLTPLSGHYSFNRADLGTIAGLGGILRSVGDFGGVLSEIDVRGTTSTPDFSIDLADAPVPLDTTFHAIVDGTNGDTILKEVDAKLLETSMSAVGAIVSRPNEKGRTVNVEVTIADGRVQDVLRLAVRGSKPVMLGRLGLHAGLVLPPGNARVADRLRLTGHFTLQRTQFTDRGVQEQLAVLSRRAQGKKPDAPIGRIVSDMSGRFAMRNGAIRFDALRFNVTGANVELAGLYTLRSEQLDFSGTLGMEAPVSKAMGGGLKGFLLKPFDPLFRKKGKGAVVPITIRGPREQPKFGVNWGKVFK